MLTLELAKLVLELEATDSPRDFFPEYFARIATVSVAEAEQVAGITLAQAVEIIETEGTLF